MNVMTYFEWTPAYFSLSWRLIAIASPLIAAQLVDRLDNRA